PSASEDGVPHIFISPLLDDPLDVLSTLLHEVIHAMTPGEGHKGGFVEIAKKVGFTSPWTSTPMGDDLHPRLDKIASRLGDYPHSKLNPAESPVKKQTTRMLKVECPESGYLVRMTRKWLDEVGAPKCPFHDETMEEAAGRVGSGSAVTCTSGTRRCPGSGGSPTRTPTTWWWRITGRVRSGRTTPCTCSVTSPVTSARRTTLWR